MYRFSITCRCIFLIIFVHSLLFFCTYLAVVISVKIWSRKPWWSHAGSPHWVNSASTTMATGAPVQNRSPPTWHTGRCPESRSSKGSTHCLNGLVQGKIDRNPLFLSPNIEVSRKMSPSFHSVNLFCGDLKPMNIRMIMDDISDVLKKSMGKHKYTYIILYSSNRDQWISIVNIHLLQWKLHHIHRQFISCDFATSAALPKAPLRRPGFKSRKRTFKRLCMCSKPWWNMVKPILFQWWNPNRVRVQVLGPVKQMKFLPSIAS